MSDNNVSVSDHIKFLLNNSLVQDNMIILVQSQIDELRLATDLIFDTASATEELEYSLAGVTYIGQIENRVNQTDARVLVFKPRV